MSKLLPGDFVSGLVAGEGCFALTFRRDPQGKRIYFRWTAQFALVMRSDDIKLLEGVKETLLCGNISLSGGNARLQVFDLNDLVHKVIPFFERYQLHGKKLDDFLLWKEAVLIIAKYKFEGLNLKKGVKGFVAATWSEDDMLRLRAIRTEMVTFKSKRDKDFKWDSLP